MGRVKNRKLNETLRKNNRSYIHFYNRFVNMAVTRFKWTGLPETIDERYLEMNLFGKGYCLFFKDDVVGYLALPCTLNGPMDVYDIPIRRMAYASNGYNIWRDKNDSVIIYNNSIHGNYVLDGEYYADKLFQLDRAMDVNAAQQKFPFFVKCDDDDYFTLKQAMEKYEGFQPFIFSTKSMDLKNSFQTFPVTVPYICGNLNTLKQSVWDEALEFLGIPSSREKKERKITSELSAENGAAASSQNSDLFMRKQACRMINAMFPELNVNCEFNYDAFKDIAAAGEPEETEPEREVE